MLCSQLSLWLCFLPDVLTVRFGVPSSVAGLALCLFSTFAALIQAFLSFFFFFPPPAGSCSFQNTLCRQHSSQALGEKLCFL